MVYETVAYITSIYHETCYCKKKQHIPFTIVVKNPPRYSTLTIYQKTTTACWNASPIITDYNFSIHRVSQTL